MGREAEGTFRWQGSEGAGRLLVESTEVILRGELRARIPREAIAGVRVEDDDLVLDTARGPLVATLGRAVAAALASTLAKPVPTLKQKLGLISGATAGCLGPIKDATLLAALAGHMAPVETATILIAEVMDDTTLAQVLDALPRLQGRHLWCVNAKGRAANLPEATIRTAMRQAGWIDSKTTGVSKTASATRYGIRKG